jgi:uncharacterized protein (TIGR02147 family)
MKTVKKVDKPREISIFLFSDYKVYLKEMVQANKGVHGYKAQLAQAMRAPQSFLSQVLHSHVHLSQDHAFRLSGFWNLSADEQSYLLDLVNIARAGSRELQEYFKSRLAELKQRNEDLSKRFKQPKVETTDHQWAYYSAWHFAAVHLLLTIPDYRTCEKIALKLELPRATIDETLAGLESMGLAKRLGSKWEVTQKSIHLSKSSPVSPVNHMIWRQRAVQDMYRQQSQRGLHYTALHTLSKGDFDRIRFQLMESIERTRAIAAPSLEEELICLAIDLFVV